MKVIGVPIMLQAFAGAVIFCAMLLGELGRFLGGQYGLEFGEMAGALLGLLLLPACIGINLLLGDQKQKLARRLSEFSTLALVAVGYAGILWMLLAGAPEATELRRVGSAKSIGEATDIALAPGGQQLAAANLHFEKLPTDCVNAAVRSTDSRQLLSAGKDGSVRLWDLASGAELVRCDGHRNQVTCVAFSADGHRAASGSADQTVRVWDLETGHQVCVGRGHTGTVNSVAFSADGSQALSRSDDGTVRVWQLPE